MKLARPLALLLALAALAGCTHRPVAAPVASERTPMPQGSGGTNAPALRERPYVVLVSFDGFRHDYLDRYPTPDFDRVAEAGVRAEGLLPVFPTLTFPNHYSIATGMYPGHHGLVGNTMYDPVFDATYRLSDREAVGDGRWYGGEPIWVTAETQGMVAASFFWVGSEAPVMGVRPTHWKVYDEDVPYTARVDSALAWLSLPPAERPHLVLLYFSAVDHAGHAYGPDSPEVAAAVAEVDATLGILLDGLARLPIADQTNVVLVSDHGIALADTTREVDVERYVTLPADTRSVGAGPALMLWMTEAEADSVDAILDAALPPGAHSYTRDELPERWHFAGSRRTPPLTVVAERPALVGRTRDFERPWTGVHGYDPADATMQGIFLAMGPQVRPAGRIAAFENVNVYPFLTAILGLAPNPEIDGAAAVLAPILRDVPAQR